MGSLCKTERERPAAGANVCFQEPGLPRLELPFLILAPAGNFSCNLLLSWSPSLSRLKQVSLVSTGLFLEKETDAPETLNRLKCIQ